MTKYQYNVNKNTIECNGDFVAYVNSVDGFKIANKLTILTKDNKQLKSENEYLRCTIEDYKSNEECNKEFIDNLHDYNQKLKKENEELKKQLIHLEYRFTEYRNKVNKND